MPVIQHNFNLPFNIIRCSYGILGVKDLAASRHFYADTIGLIETETTENAIYLRCLEERQHHSFVLKQSDTPSVLGLGFKVSKESDLTALKKHLEKLGLTTKWVKRYAQGKTLFTRSEQGIPLEFYFEMDKVERVLQKYGLYRGCAPQRFDHINCFTYDLQKTYEFFARDLGFRLTEYSESVDGDILACWMHRKGSVHDIALTNGYGPKLHHLAVFVPTALDIIHLCDLMATTGYVKNIERGPGRHGISNAFFLYILDPDGHRIEIYTSDYLTVDPDFDPIRWDFLDPQRQTLWGAPAPRSWFEHGTPFEGVEFREPLIKTQPIVAQ
ncbi:MAG: 3,4-dihydroxyphenylacetate 2,3-dioxygenase [Saprospiraceae bacterium]|nr:3,4-dihydroxyphenylacetate 2,3-dioxygenase [Saprospiraceae bacterium]